MSDVCAQSIWDDLGRHDAACDWHVRCYNSCMSRLGSITRFAVIVLLAVAVVGACFDADSGFIKPGHFGLTVASGSAASSAATLGNGVYSRVQHPATESETFALAYVSTVIASGTVPFPTRAGNPIDLFSLRVRI